jgi:ADP-ribosylglycohydrolase
VNPLKIAQAFKIIGGGKHHLDAGQPTDDTELNLAILKGLFRGKGALNLNLIA